MLVDEFNHTIDSWSAALGKYSMDDLLVKPGENDWSIGQVYMHLLNETAFYIEQMEGCFRDNQYSAGLMKDAGKVMLANNEFPDEKIKGDPEVIEKIKQPVSKQELVTDMKSLKLRMNEVWEKIITDEPGGKTMHPGLGYFTAKQWAQFAEMHLRHHFRQKQRIDEYLYSRKST